MFLMCPLTLTSPSLYLLLLGHPWWLSHLVLKTVGCILSAQGPLGGYSSSSSLVLGGQGQSLCLSPCPSTLHTSLEFLLQVRHTCAAGLECWVWAVEMLATDKWEKNVTNLTTYAAFSKWPQMQQGAVTTHNSTHYRKAHWICKKTKEVFPGEP